MTAATWTPPGLLPGCTCGGQGNCEACGAAILRHFAQQALRDEVMHLTPRLQCLTKKQPHPAHVWLCDDYRIVTICEPDPVTS